MKKISLFLAMTLMMALMAGFAPTASRSTAAPEATPEPLLCVGEELCADKEEDEVRVIILANGTEQDIVSLTIRGEEDEEYSEELLAEEEPYLADERRYVYFPAEGSYDIRLVLADETELTLHALPVDEIVEGVILIAENGLGYVEYVDDQDEQADTLEAETELYEAAVEAQRIAEEEAAKKAAEEAAAAAAAAAAAQQSNSGYGGDSGCLTGGLLW